MFIIFLPCCWHSQRETHFVYYHHHNHHHLIVHLPYYLGKNTRIKGKTKNLSRFRRTQRERITRKRREKLKIAWSWNKLTDKHLSPSLSFFPHQSPSWDLYFSSSYLFFFIHLFISFYYFASLMKLSHRHLISLRERESHLVDNFHHCICLHLHRFTFFYEWMRNKTVNLKVIKEAINVNWSKQQEEGLFFINHLNWLLNGLA